MTGWRAEDDDLPIVGDDPTLWTIAETVLILGLNSAGATKLRRWVPRSHVFPVGRRRSAVTVAGQPPMRGVGRMAKVYRAEELIEMAELLSLEKMVPRAEQPRKTY